MKPPQNSGTRAAETPSDQKIRDSEISYRRLFEAARDGILILDAETGLISDANPFLIDLLGYSHAELVGKPVWELGPFKDIVATREKFEELQKQGYVRYENLPLETRDGHVIAVEFVSNVYQAGDHNVIQCNVRDITERAAAEKARRRLAAIIEYSDDAIVSKTADGIVIGWNRGAERLYGYTAEEIIGHQIAILFPPDQYQEYLGIMKRVRDGEAVQAFDTKRIRKDGTFVDVSVGITPIEARDGVVMGASKHSHDITRIKKLEAQFIEAQKMEVIGQLASGVAHDFNNILGVIMGHTDLLAIDLEPDNPVLGHAEEIRQAAERAAGLTRQLLFFSRKQEVAMVLLDLNEVVTDLSKMLSRLTGETVELTLATGQAISPVKADAGYIGQVLMNLAVNARDAMPNGGRLQISTGSSKLDANDTRVPNCTVPGDYTLLSVSDTGSGMTQEVKDHLFEAFFTTKPKGKGTGLGLATCETIVQQCHGYIGVESELGKGTTFHIYFPSIQQPFIAASRSKTPGPMPRGTETLLIVEDEPNVRNLTCSILRTLGYEVLSASNGQMGLQVVREHKGSPICLVVTDVIMPLMGGKVMAEWLQATYPELKILFTSGYTDDALTNHGVLDPGIAFLANLYTPATLADAVRAMLDRGCLPHQEAK